MANAHHLLRVLKARLQTRLDTDYAAAFSDGSGNTVKAQVLLLDDYPNDSTRPLGPYSMLAITRDDPVPDTWGEGARAVTVSCDVEASEYGGGTTSEASNPIGGDTLLTQALDAIVDEDFNEFIALGLFDIRFRSFTQEVREPDEEGRTEIIYVKRNEITWVYFEA